jgi:hypothetical protein
MFLLYEVSQKGGLVDRASEYDTLSFDFQTNVSRISETQGVGDSFVHLNTIAPQILTAIIV